MDNQIKPKYPDYKGWHWVTYQGSICVGSPIREFRDAERVKADMVFKGYEELYISIIRI